MLLTIANNEHVRYFATFCIVSGTYTTIGLVLAWCKRGVDTHIPPPFPFLLVYDRDRSSSDGCI
jgi:hypothetical protein